MRKKEFIKKINRLKEQFIYDEKAHKSFKQILKNDFVTNYDYDIVLSDYLDLLERSVSKDGKSYDWIEYYIYELKFGEKYKDGCITDNLKNNIPLRTPEDLYNMLTT